MISKGALMLSVTTLIALRTGVANADRQSTAKATFELAMVDIEAGRIEAGCKKLAQSVASWPDSGAKGALAECSTTLGRLATAWRLWRDLAVTAPTTELRDDAAANATHLEPRIPHVRFRLRDDAPVDLKVTINGEVVNPRVEVPLAVDIGALVVVAQGAQVTPWTQTFQAVEAAVIEVEIPVAAARTIPRGMGGDVRATTSAQVLPLAVAGGGALLLGGAVGFYLWGSSRYGAARDEQMDQLRRDALYGDANTRRHVALGMGVAGLVCGGVATWLYLDRRPAETSSRAATSVRLHVVPAVGAGTGFVIVGGF